MELGRMKALGGLLQTILLKRLESSVEAFRKSIQTQIDFLSTFKGVFKEGKVLRKKFYNKYLTYLEEEEEDAAYFCVFRPIPSTHSEVNCQCKWTYLALVQYPIPEYP